MHNDVDDDPFWPRGTPHDNESDTGTYFHTTNVISRIKTSFATSSIGSLFSNSPEYRHISQNASGFSSHRRSSLAFTHENEPDDATSTSTPHIIADVKRIFNNVTRTRQASHARTDYSSCSTASSVPSISQSVSSTFGSSDFNATPPLTPDSLNDIALSPTLTSDPNSYHSGLCRYRNTNQQQRHGGIYIHEEEHVLHARNPSDEIKEGKKPERPICYDSLIADISNDPPRRVVKEALCNDADEDWYGLEYTLELSRRDRRPSDVHTPSAGESSKSRESWAVIHQGTVHPYYEDEEYYHWREWHQYLDKKDERRRMIKGLEFEERSAKMAWIYVEEMRTMDWMFWQQLDNCDIPDAEEVKEHLALLRERRPDPYVRKIKHNLAWHLKRSRSCACLRELTRRYV